MRTSRDYVKSQLDWEKGQYCSPLDGIRDIAANIVRDWGYDPSDYPGLLDDLEAECWAAFSDTARDVMRDRGLRGPADPVAVGTRAVSGVSADGGEKQ